MPTTWNRSPEDFHKIYSANTDAFYRVGGIAMAKELDEFMTRCALGCGAAAAGSPSAMSTLQTRYIPAISRSRNGCSGH